MLNAADPRADVERISPPGDLASVQHWERFYAMRPATHEQWHPQTYEEWLLEIAFDLAIGDAKPRRLLEIGCGDSNWLPYLAKKYSISGVSGVDYSPAGCELARDRLKVSNVRGTIHETNIFAVEPSALGQFDVVYSLGVVEHFEDLLSTIQTFGRFVSPGGRLITEVPNLLSIHGAMVWAWQPEIFRIHKVVTKKALAHCYGQSGFRKCEFKYMGVFSLAIPAWWMQCRSKQLQRRLAPRLCRWRSSLGSTFLRSGQKFGPWYSAPYLVGWGQAPK